jgi:hypothetical protein
MVPKEEPGLELDLQLALGHARADQLPYRREARGGRGRRAAHALQLHLVLGPDRLLQILACLGGDRSVRGQVTQCCTQHGDLAPAARRQPGREARQRRAVHVGAAFPDALVLGHVGHEVGPAFLRVEGHQAALAFAVRKVEVLGVREERVGLILPARDGDRVPGADQDDFVGESPGGGDAGAAAFEVSGHARHSSGIVVREKQRGGPVPTPAAA